jgi:RNA polymerase sigma factor (sigma-70 family)
MASKPFGAAQQLRKLFSTGVVSHFGDDRLLHQFLAERDESAFEALVERHGPMVLGVCLGVLRNPDDAQDAFQATFLILAKKGQSVRARASLGSWLYRVAYHMAVQMNADHARRRDMERHAVKPMSGIGGDDASGADLVAVLLDEVNRLPERLRLPIVLCHLEEMTHAEAAERLGWTVGTIRGRVARARALLRSRMARRGFAMSAGAIAAVMAEHQATAAMPGSWVAATVEAATSIVAGRVATVSAAYILSERGIRTMSLTKLKATVALVSTAGAALTLACLVALAVAGPPVTETGPPAQVNVPRPEVPARPVTKPDKDGALNYLGKVVERETGKPVAGAVVIVKRSVFSPSRPRADRELARTRHTTDADGVYTFSIPADQVAEKDLYLEVNVDSPRHATLPFTAYSLAAIRDGERQGVAPFFAKVAVRPGAPIWGRVLKPSGEPAAGITVQACSRAEGLKLGDPDYNYSPSSEATTDREGKFRLVVSTPGAAVVWILPKAYAPEGIRLVDNRRGDLGEFRLEPGFVVKGRVLDSDGRPLAGILVEATRELSQPEHEALNTLFVVDQIRRKATTNRDGLFTLDPLPASTYAIQPIPFEAVSSTQEIPRPLPAVFRPQTITIGPDVAPAVVELRGAPHLVVEAQIYDREGKPFGDRESVLSFSAEVDRAWWSIQASATADGKIRILVPRALENAQFDLMPGRQATALQWRIGRSGPYHWNRFHRFGALDHDVRDIEIVHLKAPVLTVKATDEAGRPIKGAIVSAQFTNAGPEPDTSYIVRDGVNSNVHFEEQPDGAFRSTSLHPGREFVITAQIAGRAPAYQTLTLAEGEKRELTLVLKAD